MTNTITNKSYIDAAHAEDVVGIDDTSDLSGPGSTPKTKKVGLEQIRHYNNVGQGIKLQKIIAKLAAVKTATPGTVYARIAVVSDSTGIGKLSTTGPDKVAHSWTTVLQNYLQKAGFNTTRSAFFASGDDTNFSTYDTRIVPGSGWTNTGATSLGGVMPFNGTTTNSLAFTPTDQWNSAKVYYPLFGSAGTISMDIDGAGAVSQSLNGSPAAAKTVMTPVTLGFHTLNISRVSGSCIVTGVECWNSTINQVQLFNCGWGGAKVTDMINSTNPYGPQGMLTFVAPDLTIFGGLINDWGAPTDLTVFTDAVDLSITTAQAFGDVMWMTGAPTANTQVPLTTQKQYVDIVRARCAFYGVPVIDVWDRFQSYEISNPLGIYGDLVHPNGVGYEIMGKAAFDMLAVAGMNTTTAGVTDGSDAPAGVVGEIITASASGVSLTTATDTNIISLLLQPGDYDLSGVSKFIAASTTIPTKLITSINSVSATQATFPNGGAFAQLEATLGTSSTNILPTGSMRVKPTVPTTYYLIGNATFTVSTLTASGALYAKRRR